jgi:hypothetical protein
MLRSTGSGLEVSEQPQRAIPRRRERNRDGPKPNLLGAVFMIDPQFKRQSVP